MPSEPEMEEAGTSGPAPKPKTTRKSARSRRPRAASTKPEEQATNGNGSAAPADTPPAEATGEISVDAEDVGAAEVVVEMLQGLAEAAEAASAASAEQGEVLSLEDVIPVAEVLPPNVPEAQAPQWYILVHQVETVEQDAAVRRKKDGRSRRFERQVDRATALLHDLFEAAVLDGSILARNERAVMRLLALLEVKPPDSKSSQRAFAEVIRNERRALAKAVGK